jgi:hypothetical protein
MAWLMGAVFGEQQPAGGVAPFVVVGRHDAPVATADDVDGGELPAGRTEGDEQVGVVGEDRVGGLLDPDDRCTGRQAAGELLQHLTATERRRRLGQPFVDDQVVPELGEVGPPPAGAAEQLVVPTRRDSGRGGTASPRLAQLCLGRMPGLGLPGRQRGGLGGGSRRLAPRGHVVDDGGPALGERVDQLPVDPVDVRDAVDDRLPPTPSRVVSSCRSCA